MLHFPFGNFSDKTKINAAVDCLIHFLTGEPPLVSINNILKHPISPNNRKVLLQPPISLLFTSFHLLYLLAKLWLAETQRQKIKCKLCLF